jgi:hypothetical protein
MNPSRGLFMGIELVPIQFVVTVLQLGYIWEPGAICGAIERKVDERER